MSWGLLSQVQALNVGETDVGFKFFTQLQVFSSLPLLGEVYGEIVSQPLLSALMWIFSCLLNV